jgi:branched-subunit amino acid transport protein AzlD
MTAAILIAAMALTTMALRFLPFLVFGKNTPAYISYLGRVLPQAIIALLVVYCLREVSFTSHPYGIPELIAGALVVGMQVWKRNSVLSILLGTAAYMIIIRVL